jgi:CheY-like chemotaxis protein
MENNKQKIILIAEDNKDARLMLKVFLENLNYKIVEAENGKEAVKAARMVLPDLILMDLQMPELDGRSAVEYIRRQNELKHIPVIANSANGNLAIELFSDLKTLGDGHIEYLPKPINLDALAELIETVLANTLTTA